LDNALKKRKYKKDLTAAELGLDKGSWRSRHRMAWLSLIAIICLNGALFLITDTKRIDSLSVALTWADASLSAIVMSYVAGRAFENIRGK
jgi:hypothetical protein